MNIPPNHQAVMPYLMLKGADGFIDFAQKVFNATETYRATREDKTVMHAEIRINGSTIMLSEATEQWPQQTANMFVYVANADETYDLSLKQGATMIMEPANQSYGRSCGVKDPLGNTWWITSVLPD